MERLTKRGTRKNGYVSAIGSGLGCWGKIVDRLAAYEDTGLTPEEVAALATPKPADHVVRGQWQGEGDGYADGEIV